MSESAAKQADLIFLLNEPVLSETDHILDESSNAPPASGPESASDSLPDVPYCPDPADLSVVTLDPRIECLTEILAKQFHESWADSRLKQGKTTSPYFKSFETLTPDEKQENTDNARLALKILLTHGFQIEFPKNPKSPPSSPKSPRELEKKLRGGNVVERSELSLEWKCLQADNWRWALIPEMYVMMARQLVHAGEADIAHDVASAGLSVIGNNSALLRWQALALVNTGAARHAFQLLGGRLDSEKAEAIQLSAENRVETDNALPSDFDTLVPQP